MPGQPGLLHPLSGRRATALTYRCPQQSREGHESAQRRDECRHHADRVRIVAPADARPVQVAEEAR
ncbi:hypothetical protein [Streptomyces sp. NRRL WC-3618]|uniref:hypothetical protein n=1 Tax=Streptomyces sp. NRRL WC-3618 TaxID=1519490 RepID=UPI00131D774D|nr:hypothetical protein [Streptomyces sp. NRRL WC-3618]